MKYLLFALLFFLNTTSVAAAEEKSWAFKVLYNNSQIGSQSFVMSPNDNGYTMNIDAEFSIDFLFITVYSYEHTNNEIWEQGCLKSLTATTNKNGTATSVHVKTLNGKTYITTPSDEYTTNQCVKTFAYWDKSFLQSKALLNTQTGETMPITTQYLGERSISYRNNIVQADYYQLQTNGFTLELWYAKENSDWLALESTFEDDRTIRYERI